MPNQQFKVKLIADFVSILRDIHPILQHPKDPATKFTNYFYFTVKYKGKIILKWRDWENYENGLSTDLIKEFVKFRLDECSQEYEYVDNGQTILTYLKLNRYSCKPVESDDDFHIRHDIKLELEHSWVWD